jgi:hypothetical protein
VSEQTSDQALELFVDRQMAELMVENSDRDEPDRAGELYVEPVELQSLELAAPPALPQVFPTKQDLGLLKPAQWPLYQGAESSDYGRRATILPACSPVSGKSSPPVTKHVPYLVSMVSPSEGSSGSSTSSRSCQPGPSIVTVNFFTWTTIAPSHPVRFVPIA